MKRGFRDISGVIGPLLEAAEVSDDGGDCRGRVTNAYLAVPYAVYTSVRMLEKHLKIETVARKVCYSRRLRALCKTSEIA